MTQTMGADYEVMLSYAERIDAMAAELEAQTAPMLAALQDGTVMSSMSQGLGPIGAPFTASYMAAMTNQCMNNMETAAGMHAHAEAIRESAEQYQGTDELHAAALEAEQTMNDDLAQGKDLLSGATEAAMPVNLKDQLDPLDPGTTQFVRDIASTRDPAGHAGIKGADLGIPAKLADGTPVMLFGDCNKPGEQGGYKGGIVAATVENTPDGVKVTGIAGWGADKLLADHALEDKHNYYPSGVITMSDGRQLLTVANVDVSGDSGEPFVPKSSHMVQIGGAEGNWQSVSGSIDVKDGHPCYSYATGQQIGDTVYVAATENNNGPVQLYEIPADKITDRSSWGQYAVGEPITGEGGGTPQMSRVGDQWVLSYMNDDALGNGVHVRISDDPGSFAGAQAQFVDIAQTGDYPSPPGAGRAYGGYVLPDSTPDDLRFGVSYFNEAEDPNGEPYGVGEWRFRPQQ
ncbi:DUF4185 domain-containing protein [Segniliparus rugosus]|uniref:DUF4185 domain-containing protein n=1 Tax=Segniliparus rugosus (strain ATCC BAA-974 / DSM 45345 / CCUG 50838 / CIP 108380 / JCM 13579 / CDC 945) TaxID=679197 RepID=E5XNC3_SEGRC|nr:DUF4185 domain-containing protein [Segniliparus rugosus]EFV14132.1 hypothetical protein HMPREF9336_01049 [Segniliparus rugosus ATCC BAA-974]